jgi:hypothetical protein
MYHYMNSSQRRRFKKAFSGGLTAAKCHMRRLASVAKCGVARSFSGGSSKPSE